MSRPTSCASPIDFINTYLIFPRLADCRVESDEQGLERFSLVTDQGGELLVFIAGDRGTADGPDPAQCHVTMAIDQKVEILQLHGHPSLNCSVDSSRPNAPAKLRRACAAAIPSPT